MVMALSESRTLTTENAESRASKRPKFKESRLWIWARDSKAGDWVRAERKWRHELPTTVGEPLAEWVTEQITAGKKWSHELTAWARCRPIQLPTVSQLAQGLAALDVPDSDAAENNSTESPVFLLSIGWRAGSTLLQRILVTDPSLLLWGEPLGEMTLVTKVAQMMSHAISPTNLGLWRNQEDPNSGELATSWVANLYPSSGDFRSALRGLFDRWLGAPARERGFTRWGFKEVRFGAAEAYLLHWLYPNAKFVLISRHPYDCYRSLADSKWEGVYYRYPDVGIDSVASFARCWNDIALSWQQLPEGFPCLQIRYSDLIGGKVDFRKLESWLNLEIRENIALKASVGGTAKRHRINWCERMIIADVAKHGMRALGYPQ
jgi:hypothetical protein